MYTRPLSSSSTCWTPGVNCAPVRLGVAVFREMILTAWQVWEILPDQGQVLCTRSERLISSLSEPTVQGIPYSKPLMLMLAHCPLLLKWPHCPMARIFSPTQLWL